LIDKSQDIVKSFKDEMARLFFLSFAVFLFILFFQPFPLGMLDYNNRLLYVTGFGAIYFLLSWIILILLPISFTKWLKLSEWESGPPVILVLLLLAITSTAFAFYIRFVGKIPLSMYILFKIVLVNLLPLLILKLLYKVRSMENTILILQEQNKTLISRLVEDEKAVGEDEFEVISENKSEKLSLKFRNIVFVKSADNYIEIYYMENGQLVKKMIRNTMKNIESQISHYKMFVRCHRTRMVNILYIAKLLRDYSGYFLKMNCTDEKIPVSRQFLLQLKEAVSEKNSV